MQCFPHRGVGRPRVDRGECRRVGVGRGRWLSPAGPAVGRADAPKAKPAPMRVVVVDDGPFAEVLERQWKARLDNELQLQQMSIADVESAKQLNADMVFYPSACLGTLVEHNLIAVPSSEALEDDQYAARDVFELQRRVEVRWGEQIYAFSFGSPHLVLMYRADVFEQLKLHVPQTWSEYAELLPRLARSVGYGRAGGRSAVDGGHRTAGRRLGRQDPAGPRGGLRLAPESVLDAVRLRDDAAAHRGPAFRPRAGRAGRGSQDEFRRTGPVARPSPAPSRADGRARRPWSSTWPSRATTDGTAAADGRGRADRLCGTARLRDGLQLRRESLDAAR